MTWKPTKEKALVDLVARRLSAREIGERIGVTRYSVTSKCHRMGVKLARSDKTVARHLWRLSQGELIRPSPIGEAGR